MPATLKEFEAVFPTLVADLKAHCQKYKLPEQALQWFEQVRLSSLLLKSQMTENESCDIEREP